MPQNREKSGRFREGVSGNPGGRPKGIVSLIRQRTKDGAELVEFMLRVFRGKLKTAGLNQRMEAATWLADRGFGRPVQAIEQSGSEEPYDPLRWLSALSRKLDATAARRDAAGAARQPASTDLLARAGADRCSESVKCR